MFGRKQSPEEKAHKVARHQAFGRCLEAKRELSVGKPLREANEAVKRLERSLAELQASNQLISTNRLYCDRLELGRKSTHPLTTDITAVVQGTGRNLVVLIEAPTWGATIDAYDSPTKAHDFVRAIRHRVAELAAGIPLVPEELAEARRARDELVARLEREAADAEAHLAALTAAG